MVSVFAVPSSSAQGREVGRGFGVGGPYGNAGVLRLKGELSDGRRSLEACSDSFAHLSFYPASPAFPHPPFSLPQCPLWPPKQAMRSIPILDYL